MTVAVIGAGFGRTGTLSLKRALDELGFGPTYHMEEVFKRPSHAGRWYRYGTTGEMDWEGIFARYGSGVDFPVSCAWRDLAEVYPDAKFVLTVRDPERWWQSTNDTIYAARQLFPRWSRLIPFIGRGVEMRDLMIWDGLFDGRFADREHAIAMFRAHNEAVQRELPPERLLVFEVADGWESLCAFLGVAVPDRPFPRVNDTRSMKRKMRAIRVAVNAPVVLVAVAVALVMVRRVWPRPPCPATGAADRLSRSRLRDRPGWPSGSTAGQVGRLAGQMLPLAASPFRAPA